MRNKKHLIFVISRFLDGGIDVILLQYLKALPSDEFDVTLAIAVDMGDLEVHLKDVPPGVRIVHLAEGEKLCGVKREKITGKPGVLRKLADEVIVNPIRRFIQRKGLTELCKEADAVIDFDAANYSLLKGIPTPKIGIYHFSIGENMRVNPRHTRRQMAGMRDYRNIVLVCDSMLEEAARIFPELAQKFARIYNGRDFEEYRRRALPPFKAERKYFVSIARLEESQKDITTLLHAYSLFKKNFVRKYSDVVPPALRLVGKGRDETKLRQLAVGLGLRTDDKEDSIADVVFMGFVKEPAPIVSSALALVLSSHYEGFGMVLLEAQILGRPAIATDCPVGPSEILDTGRAGLLVSPENPEELSQALMRVAEYKDMKPILERASESVKRFEIGKSIEDLKKLI